MMRRAVPIGIAVCAWLLSAVLPAADGRPSVFQFTTSRGMPVKIIQSGAISFVHAELLIFYRFDPADHMAPAVSFLTMLNLFREVNGRASEVISLMRALGNDCEVEQTPEYLKVSINFLPEHISTFSRLVRKIFSYGESFSLDKFNDCKSGFWRLYRAEPDWKRRLAASYAYSMLFPGQQLGHTLIPGDGLSRLNLAHVRSFYGRTYHPNNSLLVIKGNLNPYTTLGMIEKHMQLPFSRIGREAPTEKPLVQSARRVVLLDVAENDFPAVYWFDAAVTPDPPDFLPFFVLNFSLFHYPFGRFYQTTRSVFILSNEVVAHRGVSVLCNSVRLNPADVEPFILQMDAERRKVSSRPLERQEYLEALNFFFRKMKVTSGQFEQDVAVEIQKSLAENRENPAQMSQEVFFQKVSLERVNRSVEEYFTRSRAGFRDKGVIVIAGNARQLLGLFRILKPEVVHPLGEQ